MSSSPAQTTPVQSPHLYRPAGRLTVLGSTARMLMRTRRADAPFVILPIVAYAAASALTLTVVASTVTFFDIRSQLAGSYRTMAAFACTVLIIPLMSLAAAAARLSAQRRDERLSTLRLLGANSLFVNALAIIESLVFALVGCVVGTAIYYALTPAVGLLPFDGSPLGTTSLLLPVWAIAATIALFLILAALSSFIAMRAVPISFSECG